MSAIGGKADMAPRVVMSANDPERTSAIRRRLVSVELEAALGQPP
jgi:hypothetical protein